MTLRESLRGTAAALRARPELFVLGGAIGLLQAGLLGLVVASIPIEGLGSIVLAAVVLVLLSLVAVFPLFVAIYKLTLRPSPAASTATALWWAVATALRRYPAVLRTRVVATAASVSLGAVVALAWFVVATAGRYLGYLAGDPSTPTGYGSLALLVLAVSLGALLASPLFRFADCLAAFDGHGAVAAVARSATYGRRHLASLAAFAVVALAVNVGSFAVLAVVLVEASGYTTVPMPVVVAAVLLYGVAVTLTGVLQAVFYREHVAAAASTGAPSSLRQFVAARSPARVALAVVLVVGLVSGAAAVRTIDPAVHSPPERSPITTDDPDAALQAAVEGTVGASHRQVFSTRNASDPESAYREVVRSGIDYEDRQMYLHFITDDGEIRGGFIGEGTVAIPYGNGSRLEMVVIYERGRWMVFALPGWGKASQGGSEYLVVVPNSPPDGWRVVSANASTMVVRYDDPDTVDEVLAPRRDGGIAEPLANESHVTAVIDRDRGVLEEVRFHLHSLRTGRNYQYRIDYRDVGTADVERPDQIRDRRLVEALWDALYY